ncbi:hypothetical protein HD554DRAFT_2133790 [Boletus coccyginus]|nr:hypothetical protein HD554DRAFT_2133790 [Boletus coccyginus]
MSILATLSHFLVIAYRSVVALWNACIVFLQVTQSVIQETKREAAELMALLDDGAPMMDAITSTSLLLGAAESAKQWQMLIIARASSFVLLFRLSKCRVLHLEVDESLFTTKLEVIRTELALHIQHVPRLLDMPMWMHDTRFIRYTSMGLPYLWKEERTGPRCGCEVVESQVVPAAHASSVSVEAEGRSRREKYVQLLTESALRRRLHMDRLGRVGSEAAPKRGMGIAKSYAGNVVKRKALANATNMGVMHAEGSTDTDETYGLETGATDTPKQVRMARNIHAALSENLSIPNMVQATSLQKAVESVQQPRRTGLQPSLRRKRGHFDLYAQGVPSEFSLLPKTGQERD